MSAIDVAREACSQFAEEANLGGVMTAAVLLYEMSDMDEDGDIQYTVRYSSLTDSSMATVAGVIEMGRRSFILSTDPVGDDNE